jgi:hypothetical protein
MLFNFQHEVQDMNLIITALEHKVRDLQALIKKLTEQANAQLAENQPVVEPAQNNASPASQG